jgi:putative cell wall-binding protein
VKTPGLLGRKNVNKARSRFDARGARAGVSLALVTVTAGALMGAASAPSSPVEERDYFAYDADTGQRLPDDDRDYGQYDASTGEAIDTSPATPASGAGYETYPALVANANSYTVKLVRSARVEQYRAVIRDVADELAAAGFAKLTIADGQFERTDAPPPLHEIYFDTDSTSGCGADVAGCGSHGHRFRASGIDEIGTSGKVWILPVVDGYSAAWRRHVVAHEFGHVLGLQHFSDNYNGTLQVMHPSSYAVSTYQVGDRNGLSLLARDGAPIGSIESVTVPSSGKLRVTGWAFDPDQAEAAAIQITVDGVSAVQQTTNIARADINKAHSLPNYANRGFDTTITASAGAHVICLTALNYPRANYSPVGACKSVTTKGEIPTDRIQGADRYASAAAVSRAAFSGTAPVVIVASGETFPDALAAGPLAVKLGGPLLLTHGAALDASTQAEILRLKPQSVVIAGGSGSVSDAVATQLAKLTSSVARVGGIDRYETARKLASYGFSTAPTVYVASGDGFADALPASAAAGALDAPMLLVRGASDAADADTIAMLKTLKTQHTRIIGGPGVFTDGQLNSIKINVADTRRISGSDRFATSVAVSKDAYTDTSHAYIVNGMDFPDGLVTGPLAALTKSPVYLSNGDCVDRAVLTDMDRLGVSKLSLIGGTGALTAKVEAVQLCG